MDIGATLWHASVMSWRRDGGTIAGAIAGALGKGFLIGCAGLTIAFLFGSPPVAAASFWTILATAVVGTGCMLAATMIRRAQCDAEEEADAKKDIRTLITLVRKLPGLQEIEDDAPEVAPFTSRLARERNETSAGGRGR